MGYLLSVHQQVAGSNLSGALKKGSKDWNLDIFGHLLEFLFSYDFMIKAPFKV